MHMLNSRKKILKHSGCPALGNKCVESESFCSPSHFLTQKKSIFGHLWSRPSSFIWCRFFSIHIITYFWMYYEINSFSCSNAFDYIPQTIIFCNALKEKVQMLLIFLRIEIAYFYIMDVNHYNKNFRTKTQRAMEIINIYENNNSQVAKLSLLYGITPLVHPHPKPIKTIEQGKWKKMQFLQKECKFFSLDYDRSREYPRQNLKFVFKDFSGSQIIFCVSSKSQACQQEQCDQKIKSQRIMRLQIPYSGSRGIFLTFYSLQLAFFKFKYQLVAELNDQSLPERTFSESRFKFNNLPSLQRRSLHAQVKTQRSQIRLDSKHRQKSPKIQAKEVVLKDKLRLIEQEKQRLLQAKQKKVDLNIYNQKARQLKDVSKKCRGLLEQYQQFYHQHQQKSELSYRSTVMLIILSKFICSVSNEIKQETQKIKDATQLRSLIRRVAYRFMKINRNLKQMAPVAKQRQLITINSLVVLEAKSIFSFSQKEASKILMDCFGRAAVRAKINKLLVKSTEYRSKMRTLQRYWRQRNQAQLNCFQQYINHQIKDLFKKHPHFITSLMIFYEKQIGKDLSWQYLKESSQKLKNIFGSHMARLSEIEEMKQANIEIIKYNQTALKKHQRQYLQIPKIPSYPITRYFRDINLLKSMTRTWFQIQYRKQIKNLEKVKKNK